MTASEISRLIRKLYDLGIGSIRGNIAYAYWGRYPNFGDQLTPLLLRYYGFTPVYSHYEPKIKKVRKAAFVSVGTLLQNTPEDFSGIILGTGMDDVRKTFKKARILGVRGYLTKNNLGIKGDIVLGDPGLLVSFVYPKSVTKIYDLGIVPHFVDKKDPILSLWKKRFAERVTIIDVQRKSAEVISDIKQCKNVISSSLHGLVTADAFGIPNIMYVIRRNIAQCHDHKYRDYYSAMGRDLDLIEVDGTEPIDFFLSRVTEKSRSVELLKRDLHETYLNLVNYLD